MRRIQPLSVILILISTLLLLQGCLSRNPLKDRADISPDDVPKILYYSPDITSEEVPVNAKIFVKFSLSMNTDSVEQNFHYTYNNITYDSSSGRFEWNDDNSGFFFTPETSFPEDTQIGVTVEKWAKASNNNYLESDVHWEFTTTSSYDITAPSVVYFNPQAGRVVPSTTSITIEFSEPMMKPTVEIAFHLESNDDYRDSQTGEFEWDGNSVTYYPDEPLKKNEKYRIYLQAGDLVPTDYAGNPISNFVEIFYIDGEEIFVSSSNGDDSNEGTNRYIPLKSISAGIQRAEETGYLTVNIDTSSYTETVSMDSNANNIQIYGGWSPDFTSITGTTTLQSDSDIVFTITGASGITLRNLSITNNSYNSANETAVLKVSNSTGIVLDNITANGTNDATNPSHAIWVYSSSVSLTNSTLYGGNASSSKSALYIVNSSGIDINNCSSIDGGSYGNPQYGIYLDQVTDCTIEENNIISGGYSNTGETYGIYVTNNSNVEITGNYSINSGTCSGANTYAIFIEGSSNAEITDNQRIAAGSTSGANTYGIYVKDSGAANIYRNTIIGGEESTTNQNGNYGIYFEGASDSNVMNNFIVGGGANTDSNNNCTSLYIFDTNVKILNNTFDAKGRTGSSQDYYNIYADTSGVWDISPIIINNIFLGGESSHCSAIYINKNTNPEIDCVIFNNIFNDDNDSDAHPRMEFMVESTDIAIGDVNYLNGSTGADAFNPDPDGNIAYSNDSDLAFTDRDNYDYHIDVASSNPTTISNIADGGYNNSTGDYKNSVIYTPQDGALYDIDGTQRTIGQIDLGADEFQ